MPVVVAKVPKPKVFQLHQETRTKRKFTTKTAAGKFDRELNKLEKRIKAGKFWIPKPGELIYTRTSMSLDHGEDDVRGGLAVVKEVKDNGDKYSKFPGENHNRWFIEVEELPGHSYNWGVLHEEQAELQKEHKYRIAKPDPDYPRW